MAVAFGECLLGKPSHESLIKLQDYEIKLLEVMKKTVAMRVKHDRDYSQKLLNLAAESVKMEAPSYHSSLYKAWTEISNNMQCMGDSIKQCAENLQTSTHDKLVNLIEDKKAIKKHYIEHRDRIDSKFIKMTLTDERQKFNYYQKQDGFVSQAKTTYEKDLEKGKSIEKSQDKYRKLTMKMHHAHNDYVLQVMNAQMFQKHYRNDILPALMNGMQSLQVDFVSTLKSVMDEYVELTSPCREQPVSSYNYTKQCIQSTDPAGEYDAYVAVHRSQLEHEAVMNFGVVSGEGGNLPQGEIVLDSLSIQGVEQWANEFEEDLVQIDDQIQSDREYLAELETDIKLASENIERLAALFRAGDIKLLTKKLDLTRTQLELCESETYKSRLTSLKTMLQKQLDALGDDEPPEGLVLRDTDTLSQCSTSSGSFKVRSIFSGISDIKSGFTLPKKKRTPSQKSSGSDSSSSVFDHSKSFKEQSWFHGATQRGDVKHLLPFNGDFLLREGSNGNLVLTCNQEGSFRHFIVQEKDGCYRFEGEGYRTVVELVESYYESQTPITRKSNCVLVRPICKDKWTISHDDIQLDSKLGAGNFGDVYKALLKTRNTHVAVKTCKASVDASTRNKFLAEARILKGYDHPNVVKLIGICTDKQPIYIVMELVSGGDLGDYLKSNQPYLKQKKLVKLCRDACAGLAYLEEKKCIHRDVAARNCLVTDTVTVKITDFGMSREEEDGVYSVSGRMKSIPMKWTAPEAMNYGTYTHASDVWSFGVLSWEVFNFGKAPYPRMTNQQARDQVERGYRMPQPGICPTQYYDQVMLECWRFDKSDRPNFSSLLHTIDGIISTL